VLKVLFCVRFFVSVKVVVLAISTLHIRGYVRERERVPCEEEDESGDFNALCHFSRLTLKAGRVC
jgi:hypothetical protein